MSAVAQAETPQIIVLTLPHGSLAKVPTSPPIGDVLVAIQRDLGFSTVRWVAPEPDVKAIEQEAHERGYAEAVANLPGVSRW